MQTTIKKRGALKKIADKYGICILLIAENCSAREGAAINAQTDRMRDLLIGGN